MITFRLWLESYENQQQQKLRDIWRKTFDALGIGGVDRQDVLPWSLGKITFGQDNISGSGSTFKGKQAVLKRLIRSNIFQELKSLGDPELVKNVVQTEEWLNSDSSEQSNASTTIGVLLQKIFGEYFDKLLNSHGTGSVVKPVLKKAPPVPPQNNPAIVPGETQSPEMGLM